MSMGVRYNVHGQVLLPISAVRQRYNGVAVTTIERWVGDPEIAMPRPRYIGRMRFWRLDELAAWEASRPSVNPRPEVKPTPKRKAAAAVSRETADGIA
jgi:hypothetical protein